MRAAYAQLFVRMPDLELCGEASCGEEALDQIPTCHPDLVLVDLSLPRMSGFDLITQLKTMQPSLPMLVVSGHDRRAFHAPRLGNLVQGYVMKEDGPQALICSIRQVLAAGIQ
jgi:two-component system invasion response regulator UvrY